MKKILWLILALCLVASAVGIVSAVTYRDASTFTGPVAISGATTLSGATAMSGATTLSGATTISGATTQSGAITRSSLLTETGGTIGLTETVAATNVLTAAECGKTMFLSHATEFQTTLPAISTAAAGCEFEFVITAAAASANYTVITGNTKEAIITGLITLNNVQTACASEDTITFVDGNAIGDYVRVVSDGTNWLISGEAITAAKLTCTDEA